MTQTEGDSHPSDEPQIVFKAEYQKHPGKPYLGNPYVEALDPLPTEDQLIAEFSYMPDVPTAEDRKQPAFVREIDLNMLHEVVVLFPEYIVAAKAFHVMIREAYRSRNPCSTEGRKHKYAMAYAATALRQSDWKSTARGHIMMADSGMGKSTFADSIMQTFPPVIHHDQYKGTHLGKYQIPIVKLRVPHDGTVRGMCLQFFDSVDGRLGTSYGQEARNRMSIALMIDHMTRVASRVSLGLLIIDELQNLRAARNAQAEITMNLFTDILEKVGVSIFFIATPALTRAFKFSLRNVRKSAMEGNTLLPKMDVDGPQWKLFTDTLWKYQYVAIKQPITPTIREKWHQRSGGNSAFASLLFYMAQKLEIGGDREYLDADSFEDAFMTNMTFLHPAIEALHSGRPEDLAMFEDLLMSEHWREMRKQMGVKDEPIPTAPDYREEFDELRNVAEQNDERPAEEEGPKAKRTSSGKSAKLSAPIEPFVEENAIAAKF